MTAYSRAGRYDRTVKAVNKTIPTALKIAGASAAATAGGAAGYKVYKATQ
jgi:hypothetical protein